MTEIEEARVFGPGMRWLAGAMTVACAVLVGPSAPDALVGGSRPAGAVREVVPHRVMTWNLCNPCEQSNAHRAAEIAAYAPQVIGMQEACAGDVARIRNELARRYGLVYHVAYGSVLQDWGRCGGVPWNPDGYGQALLSAAPMTDRVTVEYPDGGSEDRGYMAVTTSVGGRPVRVFNTHLAERRQESVRADQVGVLAAEVARHDRAIVLGDFNAVPDAPELAPMWALATDTDSWCHPSPADGCRTTTDWHSKFDYVFLRGITALEHHVQPSAYSDHHLLETDLDLGQGVAAAPGTRRKR
ncbi:endonuclease/exonuclease/phosphatase family metal-dependent hydrolase [Streptomyces achromogenes]|uniref:Endonuclease/exonuclease/phosphatase family metal-dependent hydrolase n=1 Tax=Streptomyces achromogenes TaxID=67255 RepID=A0ABU0PSQ9_STRAH|nr:endonuclease/exonuclease/phosphatase family protein [Streptomyces achromogenes]MDQ0681427.1 endonuclease/exonuclease/phosphatase family metal-dependent hydrolase [Streptomyces achromogenes]